MDLLLFISFVFLCLSVGAGYLTYYYLKVEDNPILAIVFVSLTVLLFIICMFFGFKILNKKNDAKIKNMEIRLKKWTDISYHATKAGDEAFNKLPIGIILYDEQYHINWGNDYAKDMFSSNLDDVAIEALSIDLFNNKL